MTGIDWSPADHPYAIAVSEAQWCQRTIALGLLRLQDPQDRRSGPFSSHQIDARQLVLALSQLLTAAGLELAALRDLDMDDALVRALHDATDKFDQALPVIKVMRDALVHFDEWTQGRGRGPAPDGAGRTRRIVGREDG